MTFISNQTSRHLCPACFLLSYNILIYIQYYINLINYKKCYITSIIIYSRIASSLKPDWREVAENFATSCFFCIICGSQNCIYPDCIFSLAIPRKPVSARVCVGSNGNVLFSLGVLIFKNSLNGNTVFGFG